MANMEYLRLTGKSCRTEADRREPTEEAPMPSLVSSFAFPTVYPVSSLFSFLYPALKGLYRWKRLSADEHEYRKYER